MTYYINIVRINKRAKDLILFKRCCRYWAFTLVWIRKLSHNRSMRIKTHRHLLKYFPTTVSSLFHLSSASRYRFTSKTCLLPGNKHRFFTRPLTMSSLASKRQKTSDSTAPYELLYWPGIPGRGEHIRLCFEVTGTSYKDTCNESKAGISSMTLLTSPEAAGDATNPPPFAPPILRHGDLLIPQTPNILLYLGPRLGLAGPEDESNAIYHVNQLALTALDGFSNEAHDTHHPIAISGYYEEQKEEAKRKSKSYIETRLPKYLGYFERVLQGEASKGGEWLYGGQLTYADLVLWQCLDGVGFAFPKGFEGLRKSGKYEKVFALMERVKGQERIKEYLASERRKGYGLGIWRHYPELDIEEVWTLEGKRWALIKSPSNLMTVLIFFSLPSLLHWLTGNLTLTCPLWTWFTWPLILQSARHSCNISHHPHDRIASSNRAHVAPAIAPLPLFRKP